MVQFKKSLAAGVRRGSCRRSAVSRKGETYAGDDAALRHRLGGSRGEGAQTPQSLAGDDK